MSKTRLFHTDWLYAGQGQLLPQAWLQLDGEGRLLAFGQDGRPEGHAEYLPGLVCGGFVNAHCHLELSYLKGKIPPHTGMAGFIRDLQSIRAQFAEGEMLVAASDAAHQMYQRGIMAVGDICNHAFTAAIKQASPIHFHNFIEVFGMDPGRAETIMLAALDLAEAFGSNSSITLHAPYSISAALRDRVQTYAQARAWPQSVHMLESAQERQLFETLEGPLMQLLRDFGVPFQGHTYRSPLDFVVKSQPRECSTLLVHVTEITAPEIELVQSWLGDKASFVLCPNANRYIHHKLPPADLLAKSGARVCIGTDSLASNDQLDILSELKLLQAHFGLSTGTLLQWAIDNGLQALGLPETHFLPRIGQPYRIIHVAGFQPNSSKIPSQSTVHHIMP